MVRGGTVNLLIVVVLLLVTAFVSGGCCRTQDGGMSGTGTGH